MASFLYRLRTHCQVYLGANFSRALLAVRRPSVAAIQVFGPGYTMPVAGPGLKPSASTPPQSCPAWRTKGISFAKPLMLAAIERMRAGASATERMRLIAASIKGFAKDIPFV